MAFINFVTVIHSLYLLQLGVFAPGRQTVWNLDRMVRFVSLILDLLFRVGLCCWYIINSYNRHIQERLLTVLFGYVIHFGFGLASDDNLNEGRPAEDSSTYRSTVKFPEPRQVSTSAQYATEKQTSTVTGVKSKLPQLDEHDQWKSEWLINY